MIKPFYQGKIDTFCAIYAVLNGFRLINGIRTAKARDILNETLMNLALRPADFYSVLSQKTDYIFLVDEILNNWSPKMRIEVTLPFKNGISENEFWDVCKNWVGENGQARQRAIIFRFLRFVEPGKPALNRHWTTAEYIRKDTLHLFDCSHEAEAILNVNRSSFVTDLDRVDKDHLLYIQPDTVRFLRLAV